MFFFASVEMSVKLFTSLNDTPHKNLIIFMANSYYDNYNKYLFQTIRVFLIYPERAYITDTCL
jgi:hypothetical protein